MIKTLFIIILVRHEKLVIQMNICILTFDYPPHPVYGSGVYVDFLTKLLIEANHNVKIITVNRFGLIKDTEAIFCKCTYKEAALTNGKCVCNFGSMECMNGLLDKTIQQFEYYGFKPDVIYVNGYMFFDLAYQLKLHYKEANIVSAIHFLVEQESVADDDPERKKIYDEETRMITLSDSVIYFGSLAYELIKKRNICNMGKFNYIPHAYNVKMVKRSFKRNRRIVYASRLEPGKGIEFLCKALSNIEGEFSFDIIGTGRLYSTLNHKYGNRFRFHGYQNKEFVLEQLKNADFFVLPSFSEHCPVVVLEGMACGCIPILSNFGELPDIINKHSSGIIFDIEHTEKYFIKNIARSVEYALKIDDKSANKMIESNYQLLQNLFSPEIMLKRTLEVFENKS